MAYVMGVGRIGRPVRSPKMSFAPYEACLKKLVKGCFKMNGHFFEYAALEAGEFVPFPGYEMKLYCGPYEEWRYAKVVARRAYVVVEEGAFGEPVVEKWVIKSHNKYSL